MLYEFPRAETRLAVYRAASVSANLASILAFSLRKCSVSFLPILASMLRKCSVSLEPILASTLRKCFCQFGVGRGSGFPWRKYVCQFTADLSIRAVRLFLSVCSRRGYHVAQTFLSVCLSVFYLPVCLYV